MFNQAVILNLHVCEKKITLSANYVILAFNFIQRKLILGT